MPTSSETPASTELMTPAEAAKALRVTPRTVYLWIRSGKLKALHVSERVTRIPVAQVERLLRPSDRETPAADLSSVLWDLDPGQIDFDAHARLIIARILEAGRPTQVRWMFQRYPFELVLDVAENARGLSHRAAVAWSTLLRDRMSRVA